MENKKSRRKLMIGYFLSIIGLIISFSLSNTLFLFFGFILIIIGMLLFRLGLIDMEI